MPTFTVRRAALEDAADICALDRDGLGYDYPPEKTREKLRAALADLAQAVLVAVQDGQTAGYAHAQVYDVLYADRMANLLGIAVRADLRGQGVGRALLAAVERWAGETGAAGVRLNSGETRAGAHVFYER